ncbi:hypothetical protein ILUMI_12265 [Ignelater luminosus]|uniref:Uncharacterized protein n=1 Tax=Ignelater luminosus TaxID=2038154 RepID=A0A8K0GD44_IGNLU|nr:hypothetical protein ILUMI_12265 [Ignelater luminosus]
MSSSDSEEDTVEKEMLPKTMTEHCFNKLCEYVKPLFHATHTNYRKTISFKERLAVTLRYLATGESFSSEPYRFCISHNEIASRPLLMASSTNAISEMPTPVSAAVIDFILSKLISQDSLERRID